MSYSLGDNWSNPLRLTNELCSCLLLGSTLDFSLRQSRSSALPQRAQHHLKAPRSTGPESASTDVLCRLRYMPYLTPSLTASLPRIYIRGNPLADELPPVQFKPVTSQPTPLVQPNNTCNAVKISHLSCLKILKACICESTKSSPAALLALPLSKHIHDTSISRGARRSRAVGPFTRERQIKVKVKPQFDRRMAIKGRQAYPD